MKYGVYYWRRIGSNDNPIKIGKWSDSPEKTIDQYEQRGDPRPAELLAVEYSESGKNALILEKSRHKEFGISRIRGEWFKADENLLIHISKISKGEKPKILTQELLAPDKMDKENLKVSALILPSLNAVISKRKKFRLLGLRWPI